MIEYNISAQDLDVILGDTSYKWLLEEVYFRYQFTPAKMEIEEHHVAVYAAKDSSHMKKAPILLHS